MRWIAEIMVNTTFTLVAKSKCKYFKWKEEDEEPISAVN